MCFVKKLVEVRSGWCRGRQGPVRLATLAILSMVAVLPARVWASEENAAVEARLLDAVSYLASEECEGRGPGTKGIDLAAQYIAHRFEDAGLKTDLFDGKPFQKFSIPGSSRVGNASTLTLVGPPSIEGGQPQSIELKLDADFTPLASTSSGTFDLPLAFVGYGITAEKEGYDDYDGIDVNGKVVIVLRHEPQQDNPDSAFAGTKDSIHATLRRKLENARKHGAAGVIFCTDQFEIRKNVEQSRAKWLKALDELAAEHEKLKKADVKTVDEIEKQRARIDALLEKVDALGDELAEQCDPVLPFQAGGGPPAGFPVVHCRHGVLDRVVKAAGTDLATLEQQIDEGPKPHSLALPDWRAVGRIEVGRKDIEVKNVIAVLEGEGPHAEETIVVGAHYDHLGFRADRSGKREVYNGADDNASGVSAMLELARTLAAADKKPSRRVVFIAFTGEERGLLGSRYYVEHPLFPLEKTVAMINLDMVGRLRDDSLTVMGTGTAKEFDALVDRAGQTHGLKITKRPSGFGPSDLTSFYRKEIPVLFFITGMHGDLHRPTDDVEKINVPGMRRVTGLVKDVLVELVDGPQRPEYVFVPGGRGKIDGVMRIIRSVVPGGNRPFFGTMPDSNQNQSGYTIGAILRGGPAEKAGLKGGDVVVRLGDADIRNLRDMFGALQKHKPGDRVHVVVRRGDEKIEVDVTLAKPPG